ncbi:hypothetical protein EDD16DRAFT_1564709 [Pisolithus croceorrhizus]|nr:hypothetical protein EDD16DRAFT_1564709 [Pisolithus croceorrhizus]KAI6133983.1 hypothetical protein EV401DRAFT_1911030 [Pisolithus croceorrhizus]KAI6137611.1 hypothetical protein EDD17DRAFT_442782 [Pisolithus thermaeus]
MLPIRTFKVFAVLVTACRSVVLGFQPGSDYGQYKTSNLYNCSGSFPTSNLTVKNSVDTLPQIQPSSASGWEQWEFITHGTFSIVLRWSHGDQSKARSTDSVGRIEVIIPDVNGTTVQTTVFGKLSYSNNNGKEVRIGGNSFKWDDASAWYNVTLNVDGYSLVLNSYSAMLDTFHPDVGYYNGRLSSVGGPGLYGSIPVTRGQISGYLVTPDGQNITLDGLAVLQHTFSEQPLPVYVNKYSSAIIWGYSTTFYDTHAFYHIQELNGTVHEAAYLGRAIAGLVVRSDFQSTWDTYAVTDDTNLYQLAVDPTSQKINVSLPGCALTNNISYTFNVTESSRIGQFTDVGGGRTTYYALNGTTLAPYGGSIANGTIAGAYVVYEAPAR